MPAYRNLRKRMRLTWQQRAAGVGLLMFLVMHAPTFSFMVEFSDDTVRNQKWSPLQAVAVGLIKTSPEMAPYTKYILLPGTFFETLVLTIDACYVDPSRLDPCDWGKLKDWNGLLQRADVTDKVDVFVEKMGEYRPFVQGTAAAATMFSITSAFLDGSIGLILGYAGLAYTTNKAGCEIIAVTNMCVAMIIAIYIIMNPGNDEGTERAPAKESVQKSVKELKKTK